MTETQLADVVGIARQTLVRRKRQGVLRRDEGDRAAMVARMFNPMIVVASSVDSRSLSGHA